MNDMITTLNTLNVEIFSIDNNIVDSLREILAKEQDKNELEKKLEEIVEEKKVIVWSDKNYKNNDQRNAALNVELLQLFEYNLLIGKISNLEITIKELKLNIENLKANKNFHKRSFDINMNYFKSLQSNKE